MPFFGAKKEREAFKNLAKHAAAVCETARMLRELYQGLSKYDHALVEETAKKISAQEYEADKRRQKFEIGLHEGAFLPLFRSDLFNLAERTDTVADEVKHVGRALARREKLCVALKKAAKKDKKIVALVGGLETLAAKVIETVECLTDAIEALETDVEKAAKLAEQMSKLEEDADEIEDWLTRDIYDLERSLDPITVLQLRDTVMWTGRVANWAEDAGDIITMIAMKHWA
jgi:hypothetical protein